MTREQRRASLCSLGEHRWPGAAAAAEAFCFKYLQQMFCYLIVRIGTSPVPPCPPDLFVMDVLAFESTNLLLSFYCKRADKTRAHKI